MDTKPLLYIRKKLHDWGVQIVNRPDIFDDRNRWVTVVLNEKIDGVCFKDALTLTMSADTLNDLVYIMSCNICDDFMKDFIYAINMYGKWMKPIMKKQCGSKWWREALERIEYVLKIYEIDIKRFDQLDYNKCVAHFGSKRAFRQVIIDAVCYRFNDMPQCLICKHCKCKRDGSRVCSQVFVPVTEGRGVKTLRIIADHQISNRVEDIAPITKNTCKRFETNHTEIIDWAVRFRNAHF